MTKVEDIFSLKNKVVILTGSAGKLGWQFSHILSAAGANVVLVDLQNEKNKRLEKILRDKFHTKPTSLTLDISNIDDVKKLVSHTIKKYKKIDILINNAHLSSRSHKLRDNKFEEYPIELWDILVTKNLLGIFLCSREIGNLMSKQNNGNIINISSIYGLVGPNQKIYGKSRLNSPVSYSVNKGGVVNLTRYLASYWSDKKIRVNTLTLGGVLDQKTHSKTFVKNYSEKTIIGRMADIHDYDGAILFLSSDASSYMTGSNLIVDGGWTAW